MGCLGVHFALCKEPADDLWLYFKRVRAFFLHVGIATLWLVSGCNGDCGRRG
jgi:hypothetical protein